MRRRPGAAAKRWGESAAHRRRRTGKKKEHNKEQELRKPELFFLYCKFSSSRKGSTDRRDATQTQSREKRVLFLVAGWLPWETGNAQRVIIQRPARVSVGQPFTSLFGGILLRGTSFKIYSPSFFKSSNVSSPRSSGILQYLHSLNVFFEHDSFGTNVFFPLSVAHFDRDL